MVLSMIFSFLILVIVVYISMRVLGNVFYGVLLIGLIFVASFLILGSFPELKNIPIIGKYLPDIPNFPSTTGEAINVIRNVFYKLDVIGYERASSGNLLVIVANRGKMDLSGFSVEVNGIEVDIVNVPKDPLKSGEATAIEVDWKWSFQTITVKTTQATANYPYD